MKTPIRLIIADDHAIFRSGLKSLLRRQREMQVVAEVDSAGALAQALAHTACDVLLLDLQMERWALDDIKELSDLTRVVVLTASESVENAVRAMRLGARAVVQKRFAVRTLMEAIHAVVDGLVWMPPTLQVEIAAQWGASAAKQLTIRETEIVRQVATGLRNAEIAERLSITETTVKTHLNHIFSKLELRDRVELAVYALRHGLVAKQTPSEGSGPA
ncbi:MAG TPA: response regulator transcription factor [Candidatus Binataceae bacterium]|nr:response regulator transcription factor [Candidatus Binataceae bacterium]